MEVWWTMCKWQVEYVLNCEITHVFWDVVCIESYKLYNHTTITPFKNDELMHDEYCDGIYYGNPTSLITLRTIEESCVLYSS